jgi:osmotically-inducible protein OsmY
MDAIGKSDVQIPRDPLDEHRIGVESPGSDERNDTDIAQAVRHGLESDVLVQQGRIRATVSKGVVTLEGTVDYLSQYVDAIRCVRNLPGVRTVNSLVAVWPSLPKLAPLTIRNAIERALERHGEHTARRVQIAVAAGRVTLSGSVPSSSDRSAVEVAVRATPGVLKVENQLLCQA